MDGRPLLLQPLVAGNEAWRILAFFLAILFALIVGRLLRVIFQHSGARLERAGRRVPAAAARATAAACGFTAFAIGIRFGLHFLVLAPPVASLAGTVAGVLLVCAGGWIAWCMVEPVEAMIRRARGEAPSSMDQMVLPILRKSLRITIVALTLLQIATLLSDKPVTSLIAGLGVGGLAVALAAQETIKNFFGSLVIFMDKPFVPGDRIVVDGHDGPVQEVGMRSTRIRTLQGNLVTIPNGELANKTILNISKRPYIQRVMNLSVPYDTPPAKVERALEIVREVLRDHEGSLPEFPPRVFFKELDATALTLSAIYWYAPPDYWAYMAFSEKVNLQLFRRFGEEGIEFAFPTQTVHLAGSGARTAEPVT